jgi:DEAD/DEAH box helicase domain-containing protein
MCESRDLGKAVGSGDNDWSAQVSGKGRGELRGPSGEVLDAGAMAEFAPAVYLYDNYPGGIGLSRPLFERRDELIAAAAGLVAGCRCGSGCPACVGPILASDEQRSPKGSALRVLALLRASVGAAPDAVADSRPVASGLH